MNPRELTSTGRRAILFAAIAGLLFDGLELGMMPVASMSVTESLVGAGYNSTIGGVWFAYYTASLMLGAAIGGLALGRLGDSIGRSKALGVSVLFYSLFAGMGAWVQTQEQMLILRFIVGLGVGGVWPNAVALASECWPNRSRPVIAGLLGAALNGGVLLLSIIARNFPITADSWRWLFGLAALPAVLGILVVAFLPESPSWLAVRRAAKERDRNGNELGLKSDVLRQLFKPPLLQVTLLAIVLGSVPLVGAWAASKWMIPWADSISKVAFPGYKAQVQSWWAIGATLGSFSGAQIAGYLGRRRAYAVISVGATVLTLVMFLGTRPLHPSFLPIVFAQGFVTTLFFGWLPLYLPQMFPTHVRATGSGIAFNTGRFATAIGVLLVGQLFGAVKAFSIVGACGALIYALGLVAIWLAPDTAEEPRS